MRRSLGQRLQKLQCLPKMGYCLPIGRPPCSAIACPLPISDSLLQLAGTSVVLREDFRLDLCQIWKALFEDDCNARVQVGASCAQQSIVGHILNERMLEQILRMGRQALSEQQTGFD